MANCVFDFLDSNVQGDGSTIAVYRTKIGYTSTQFGKSMMEVHCASKEDIKILARKKGLKTDWLYFKVQVACPF